MSYGAGHIIDMINRMKQNRSMLSSKRQKFKSKNREGIYSETKKGKQVKDHSLTEEELNQLKKEIAKRTQEEHRRVWIISIVIVLFIFIIFLLFSFWKF